MKKIGDIKDAISNTATLIIKYHAGSQPGTLRRITPLSIDKDRIMARCHATGRTKVFILEKIKLCQSEQDGSEWTDEPRKPNFESLNDVHHAYRDTLEAMGWCVRFEEGDEHAYLSLHRRFKNGKMIKSPDASLSFQRYRDDEYFDGEDFVKPEVPTLRKYPYTIRGKHAATKSFGKLDRAVEKFMESAQALKQSA
jgi:hypothetical protein